MAAAYEIKQRLRIHRMYTYQCCGCGRTHCPDTEREAAEMSMKMEAEGWGLRGEEELLCPACAGEEAV